METVNVELVPIPGRDSDQHIHVYQNRVLPSIKPTTHRPAAEATAQNAPHTYQSLDRGPHTYETNKVSAPVPGRDSDQHIHVYQNRVLPSIKPTTHQPATEATAKNATHTYQSLDLGPNTYETNKVSAVEDSNQESPYYSTQLPPAVGTARNEPHTYQSLELPYPGPHTDETIVSTGKDSNKESPYYSTPALPSTSTADDPKRQTSTFVRRGILCTCCLVIIVLIAVIIVLVVLFTSNKVPTDIESTSEVVTTDHTALPNTERTTERMALSITKDINECASGPCRNGGACQQDGNVCQCAQGYTGINCEQNINECASSPCLNGGLCVDGINRFTCQCAAGFTGTNCQTTEGSVIAVDSFSGFPVIEPCSFYPSWVVRPCMIRMEIQSSTLDAVRVTVTSYATNTALFTSSACSSSSQYGFRQVTAQRNQMGKGIIEACVEYKCTGGKVQQGTFPAQIDPVGTDMTAVKIMVRDDLTRSLLSCMYCTDLASPLFGTIPACSGSPPSTTSITFTPPDIFGIFVGLYQGPTGSFPPNVVNHNIGDCQTSASGMTNALRIICP